MAAGVLMAKLGVIDTMTPKLRKARKALTGLASVTAAGWAPKLIDGIGRATTAFINFDGALNQFKAVSGATDEQMLAMQQQAKDLGATTMFSAQQAAEAQSFLAMAGLEVDQVMRALPDTLNLAAAGNLDLGRAADLATNVMSGMNLQVKDLGMVTDVMAQIAASANTNVDQFGEAMQYASAQAVDSGLNIQTTAAAIGVLSNRGIQGSRAGTSLRTALAQLNQKGEKAGGTITTLNGKLLDHSIQILDAKGKMLPLTQVLDNLGKAGLTSGQMLALGGQEGGSALSNLVKGKDELKGLEDALFQAGGAAAEMARVQQEGITGLKTQFVSAVDGMWIALGQRFAPVMAKVIKASTESARAIIEWAEKSKTAKAIVGTLTFTLEHIGTAMKALIVLATTLGARWVMMNGVMVASTLASKALAIAIGVKTAALKLWAAALTIGTGGLNLVIPLIAGAAAAFVLWGDEIKGFLGRIWNKFIDVVGKAMPVISVIARALGKDLPDNLDALKVSLNDTTEASSKFNTTLPEFKGELEAAKKQLQQAKDGVIQMHGSVDDADEATQNWINDLERHVVVLGQEEEAASVAAVAAEKSAEAAREANKAFLKWAGGVKELQDKLSALALKSTTIQQGFRAAGNNAGLEFNLGFMSGPGGVMNTIPQSMQKLSDDGSFMLAGGIGGEKFGQEAGTKGGAKFLSVWNETVSPKNIFDTISRAFEGGGGYLGGIKSLGAQIGGDFLQGMQDGTLSKMEGVMGQIGSKMESLWKGITGALSAIPFAGQILAAFGPKLLEGLGKIGKKVWTTIKGWFGGPSEAELAARNTFEGVRKGFVETIGTMPKYQEYVNSLLSQGWDRRLAEVKAGFDYWGRKAGMTWEEIGVLYTQYQEALQRGDTATMERIMGRLTAVETAERESNERRLAEEQRITDLRNSTIDSVAQSYRSLEEAAEAERVKAVQAAVEAGASEEEARRSGVAAYEKAYKEKKELRITEMAEEAAFSAALQAIKNGDAENAAAAARKAYNETREAAIEAFAAVEAASEAAAQTSIEATEAVQDANEDLAEQAEKIAEQQETAMKAAKQEEVDAIKRGDKEAVKSAREKQDKILLKAEEAKFALIEKSKQTKEGVDSEQDAMLKKAEDNFNKQVSSYGKTKDKTIAEAVKLRDGINQVMDGINKSYTIVVTKKVLEQTQAGRPDGKAFGGRVLSGREYMVGERGPELFRPGASGSIVPNHRLRAGSTPTNVRVTIKVDENMVHGTSLQRALAEATVEEIPKVLGAHGLT